MSSTLAMVAAALITAILIAVLIARTRVVENGSAGTSAAGIRILAEHVVDMVSTHDANGTFHYVSSVLAGVLGEYPGLLAGRHPRDFAHPDDVHAIEGLFKRASSWSGVPATITWRCRRHDGDYAWVESVARAAPPNAAELGAIVCASRDVTERKQIEDALRESEQRFRTAVETVRLVAVSLDTNGRVTFCNDALCAQTGWTRADLIGENWFDVCIPPGDPIREHFLANITSGSIAAKSEGEIVCRDGKRRLVEWDNTVLRTAAGDVLGTASLGADVTERRHEETSLKLLQSITLAISAANELNAALSLTLQSLCGATRWGYGEAWLPTGEQEHMSRTTHFAAVGVDARRLIDGGATAQFAPGHGLPGRAWESKSVLWVPDISSLESEGSQELASRSVEAGFRAAVAIPVLAGLDVVAVLVFFMDRPRASDVRHTQMVEVVANQVGAVIERRLVQKRYEVELLRARDEAEAASHAKSDFLSRMSHELRTPLNSVIGFANVLKKNKAGRLVPEDIAFLDRIRANGQHLLTLVNNVLDIAKVEAGRLTVTTSMVNVDELLRDVVAQLEGQPRPAEVELRADVAGEMLPMQSDLVLLRQVLINLTGNALRFTLTGSIVLTADSDAEGMPVRIHVTDTGIGIGPELHSVIFEPFEQADPTTQRKYGGTGLGLAISRAICDALGYVITLESEVGKGSRFTVHLGGVSKSEQDVPLPDNHPVAATRPESVQAQQS